MKKILGVMFGVVVAMTLFLPVSNAVSAHSGTANVTNETVSAEVGTYQDLTGYDIDNSTVTVWWYNSSSGSYEQLSDGSDYELAVENGSIKPLSSGDVSDSDELKVSYEYQQTDGSTTTVITLIPLLLGVLVIGKMSMVIQEKV